MNFLQRIFAGSAAHDPTAGWPAPDGTVPEVNLAAGTIGRLTFGDPLASAQYLGKPAPCRLLNVDESANYLELIYAKAGFQVNFDYGRFAYAAFFVGPDRLQPEVAGLNYCSPCEFAAGQFSRDTQKEDLIRAFGEPDSIDAEDADDVVVSFCRKGLVLEFEMNENGRLKRWNLYPEQEIPQ